MVEQLDLVTLIIDVVLGSYLFTFLINLSLSLRYKFMYQDDPDQSWMVLLIVLLLFMVNYPVPRFQLALMGGLAWYIATLIPLAAQRLRIKPSPLSAQRGRLNHD